MASPHRVVPPMYTGSNLKAFGMMGNLWKSTEIIKTLGKIEIQMTLVDCNFDPLTFPMLQDILAEMP